MCTTMVLGEALDQLTAEDVAVLSDDGLATQVRDLLTAVNRLNAEIDRRVHAFDNRGLSTPDGCRSTTSWLKAFGRLSGPAASSTVKRARLAERFPELAAAA